MENGKHMMTPEEMKKMHKGEMMMDDMHPSKGMEPKHKKMDKK